MRLSRLIHALAKWNPKLQGLLFGAFTALLLVSVDQLSLHFGLTVSQRILDDIVGGAIAGGVVYIYARVRCGYIEQRLRTVELMNHHIRNALQVIRYAGYMSGSEQAERVDDAIERIDWALREILTGRVTSYDENHTDQPNSTAA